MNNKIAIIITSVIVIAVVIVVAVMMSTDSNPAAFDIKDGSLVITCSFGTTVPLSEISSLEFTDTAPDIKTKTNGAGIGSMQKGEYLLADGSKARLYIDTSASAFVRFVQGDTVFYLSADSAEATKELFAQLDAAVN